MESDYLTMESEEVRELLAMIDRAEETPATGCCELSAINRLGTLSYWGGSLRIPAHLAPNLADAPRYAADTVCRNKRAQHPLSRIGNSGNADKELQTNLSPAIGRSV